MTKFRFLFLIFFISFFHLSAQNRFGNEWIDFNQTYFKIKIGKEGVYRINYITLLNAGVPVNTLNPKNFMLFREGVEQPLFIHGESDNKMDPGDFIAFYGKRNDGTTDSGLYQKPENQPHKFYSLYTDTANYFLTWSSTSQGKRFNPFYQNNYGAYTPETYFMHTENAYFPEFYSEGEVLNDYGKLSDYTECEGWLANNFGKGGTQTRDVSTPFYFTAGPNPRATISVHGNSNSYTTDPQGFNHHLQVHVHTSASNFSLIADQKNKGYTRYLFNVTLDSTKINKAGSNITRFRFNSVNDVGATIDNHSVGYISVTYPRQFKLPAGGGSLFSFKLTGNQGTMSYVVFDNYPAPARQNPSILDLTNNLIIKADISGTSLRAIVPDAGKSKDLVIFDSLDLTSVELLPVNFIDFKPETNEYDFLIVTHSSLLMGANEYSLYKSSTGYKPLVVTSEQLYDQFYYGLHHPLSVKNFCNFLIQKGKIRPEYLLLLGKGQTNNIIRKNSVNFNNDLVPAIGLPPSDYMFTSGLENSNFEPSLATGRISAKTNAQILIYLDKLKLHESSQPDMWKKNILHLAGGRSFDENFSYKSFLKGYEKIANGKFFGGKVTTYSKSDALPVAIGLKETIQDEINQGKSIMNYFGHGAADILEIDIGLASELKNKGKYPIMYFSGCILGNTYAGSSLAEQFLFEPEKGSLSWIANSGYGFVNNLQIFSNVFYENLFKKSYGNSIGNQIKNTIKDFQIPGNLFNEIHSRQMTLQGDPSLKFYQPEKPDYYITPNNLYIYPENTTAISDSFAVAMKISNLGKATDDSLNISVKRTFPDNSTIIYPNLKVKPIYHSDTVFFVIYSKDINTKGINRFQITLDPQNEISELGPLGETNNVASFEFYMPAEGVEIVSPLNFGIVSSPVINLVAQSNSIFTKNTDYLFQIDTVPHFNSPWFKTSGKIKSDLIAKWQVNLQFNDSVVYYWRVKQDVPDSLGGLWRTASFTYINGSPRGWSQSHFPQYSDISPDYIHLDTLNRNFEFSRTTSVLHQLSTAGANESWPFNRIMRIDYWASRYQGVIGDGIAIMAINPDDMTRWSHPSTFNQKATVTVGPDQPYYKAGNYTGTYFFNTLTKSNRDSLEEYLKNIPEGYHIMCHSGKTTGRANWDTSLFNAFSSVGAQLIQTLKEGWPYILIGKKGMAPGTATEITADTTLSTDPLLQTISHTVVFYPKVISGSILSSKIGPSTKWREVYFKKGVPDHARDSMSFDIIGIDSSGAEQLLISHINSDSYDLSGVNSKAFPFLKIKGNIFDDSLRTPTQLKQWTVLFDGVPEGTLNPSLNYAFYKDTIQEGDSVSISIAFQNISSFNMDSVLVEIKETDRDRVETLLERKKMKPLTPNESFLINKKIPTAGKLGKNSVIINVNPGRDQPEVTLFNNYLSKEYLVTGDTKNPVLDVVFDGIHILNNDIVSPFPTIVISNTDENPFLFIKDTSNIVVSLRKPNSSSYERIHYNRTDVTFIPSAAPGKKAIFEFRPQDLVTGEYELRVQATDASGNKSGNQEYNVKFKVITESSITHFYPYPNPFTTGMRFVFTLTGSKIPDQLKIQIMSVTGKIVREITKNELGNMKIGNNISDFVWDGTDEFGDKLANGVYLYKVSAKIDGKDLDLMESAGDNLFKSNFGKIYILR